MRIKLMALLVAALGFGFAPSFVNADETKKDEKKCEEKQGGCCKEGKADEAKADEKAEGGCCKDDAAKKAAKKDDCEGCGKDEKSFSKAMTCKACTNSEKGPCEECIAAVKAGKVVVVPISGMTCGNCEGAVSAKLEKIDGIKKYAVMHRFNGAALVIEPGKTVKLSEIKKSLGEGKFQIDESAKLVGKLTLSIENSTDEKTMKKASEVLCALIGDKDCKEVSTCCAGLTFTACGKNVTIKQLRDKLAESKIVLADIEYHGAKADAANGKS
ncbi:MAG: cation transporter [Planctomycetota bacterium]